MAGIKSTARREPPRKLWYFDVTDVFIIIHGESACGFLM